jgi:cytochrome c oxidase subunit 2
MLTLNFFLLYFIYFILQLSQVKLDAATPWQLYFQDSATPFMEGLINFHNDLMFFLIVILIFVSWVLIRCIFLFKNKSISENFVHGTAIEIIWTIIPALILIVIAIPSFALLYSMDEIIDPVITLKIIGHQWYWSYEYSDIALNSINFDSYMIPTADLEIGQLRLLEVDNRVVLPINTHIRLIITSSDVLHSWAIPSLGIKLDACPGRLNQVNLFIKREGVFYGQCSEICGINHGFMPIVVEATTLDNYINWLDTN